MPLLTVLRHAKSSWNDSSLADHDRPLNERGRVDAPHMAQRLLGTAPPPDLVRCSTARRAQETLALLEAWVGNAPVSSEPELYGASAAELRDRLRDSEATAGHVLLIGHNPGIGEFAAALASSPEHAADRLGKFPTCAVAMLDVEVPWEALDWRTGRLSRVLTPKDAAGTDGGR
ncbi:hypothetical protein ER308_16175 [Egibacter rhizosphaerae]|uniref:Histidine phosphatase family protein n=1 Tax=Egibacter rhizosphaerae TaxID=1670831 RepID=A0A411YID5_9ACTN|nr:histidine phosphatase family protein [Egibacter rhizosphaerae]QBI20957.1 hypothetical protein ER308_16175 [Egibacter rhizosphaerae]